MTRNECLEILKNKNHPQYKELHSTFFTNKNKCRKYYDSLGYKGYTLHHKIVNCDNYEEWKIDEIEPMTRSEHSRLHMMFYKQGLGSPQSIEKAHNTLKRKYATGEITVWNKGLTKETDSRIKESPRKGKTGKEFPFLCASKKGKSGGWSKGISKDDPRYSSLLHTDEQNKKQSDFMKKNNPMFDEQKRQKCLEKIRSEEVQNKRKEKMIGRKLYTNGIEKHFYKPGTQPEDYILIKDFKRRCNNEK